MVVEILNQPMLVLECILGSCWVDVTRNMGILAENDANNSNIVPYKLIKIMDYQTFLKFP